MYIYGIHPVEEVLRRAPKMVEEIAVAGRLEDRQFEAIREMVQKRRVLVRNLTVEELTELTEGGNHQRIAARVSEFPYQSLDEVIAATREKEAVCFLALAQVQDPGNLGAILRSAAAFDVDAVLIPKHRAAQVTATVVRASAGMVFEVPIVQVTNLAKALEALKKEGFWTAGTVAEGGQPLWTMDWQMKVALVMGGEHKGMRPGVEKACDFRLTVPLKKEVESLNVSAAAAVALYERLRGLSQR